MPAFLTIIINHLFSAAEFDSDNLENLELPNVDTRPDDMSCTVSSHYNMLTEQ